MQRLSVMLCAWGIAACASSPHVIHSTPQGMERTSVTLLLAMHPLPEGENISATLLGRTDALSFHLVQIRDRERPHVHAEHDLTVVVLQGSGRLYIDGIAHDMRAGDVAVVPRGTPHYFVNSASTPAAAFVTFAPSYDGKDQLPVVQER